MPALDLEPVEAPKLDLEEVKPDAAFASDKPFIPNITELRQGKVVASGSMPLPPASLLYNLGIPEPFPEVEGDSGLASTAKAIGNLPVDALNFAGSPAGLALGGSVPKLPKSLQTLIGAIFTGQGVHQAVTAPTLQGKISGILQAGLGGAGTLVHAISPILGEPKAELPPTPDQIPTPELDEIAPPTRLAILQTELKRIHDDPNLSEEQYNLAYKNLINDYEASINGEPSAEAPISAPEAQPVAPEAGQPVPAEQPTPEGTGVPIPTATESLPEGQLDAETPDLGTTGAGGEPTPEAGSPVLGAGDEQTQANAVPQDATAPVGAEPPQAPSQEVAPPPESQSPTGIRNAIVDQQRLDRGLPERYAPLRKTNPEAWDSAVAEIDKNPNAGRDLVDTLKDQPTALTPEKSALLAHETVTRENAFDSAIDDVNNAKTPEDLAEVKQRLARARDDVQELYDVGQKAGTESGQSLQARKMLVNQDYSLAKMEATKRAIANDGKPLSESQAAEVKAAHDKISELKAKLDEHENAASQSKQLELYRQILKESLSSAKTDAKAGRTLQSTLDNAAAKARERIIARRGQLQITVDPLNVAGLVDEAIIGASHISRGVKTLADFTTEMVKDFGERIRPFLSELYQRAKDIHSAHAEAFTKKTPQEVALARYKTATGNRTDALLEKIAGEDFTKTKRNKTQLDAEALQIKAAYQRAKDQFDSGVEKDRLANRTPTEKVLDTLAKWRRGFVLSSPVTLAKLTSAAFERMAFTPIEEGVGSLISKAIPMVAKRAPREGGASIKAESQALTEGFTKGMRDAYDVLRTGKSDLDTLYGKRDIAPRSLIDYIGNLHGALKTVTKRNEFARSFQKRVESAMASGIDTSDPLVQTRLATEAYKDANRSIFLQDNRVVTAYKSAIAALERPNKATGQVPIGGKISATAAKVLLPVVKVPTNIVAETMQYAVGSITGSVRLANAFRKGIDKLPPEQADLILRDLKKGSIGAAVLMLGYTNADNIGGYYQPGDKRKAGDVKFGRIRIGGYDVPSYLVHNPLLETLQIGATIRRVADSKLRVHDANKQGIMSGVLAAGLGVTDEVPFVRQMLGELPKLLDPRERGQYLGELSKSLVVPQGVQWIAQEMDQRNGEVVKRKPKNILQSIETGIPGLRSKVPEKP